jgi:hypothetical protein
MCGPAYVELNFFFRPRHQCRFVIAPPPSSVFLKQTSSTKPGQLGTPASRIFAVIFSLSSLPTCSFSLSARSNSLSVQKLCSLRRLHIVAEPKPYTRTQKNHLFEMVSPLKDSVLVPHEILGIADILEQGYVPYPSAPIWAS